MAREGSFRDGNCQTSHESGVLTFQGTQKICLPYSPTKTLSVKSILRWVLKRRNPTPQAFISVFLLRSFSYHFSTSWSLDHVPDILLRLWHAVRPAVLTAACRTGTAVSPLWRGGGGSSEREQHTASVWWELSSALTHLRTAYVACSFFLAGMQILRFHKENQEIFFLSFSCFEIETRMSANAS